jgi:hypothetical protein
MICIYLLKIVYKMLSGWSQPRKSKYVRNVIGLDVISIEGHVPAHTNLL